MPNTHALKGMTQVMLGVDALQGLVQKDAHVRRTCVGVHPSYTSSRSPLSRNKWCCLPSVRSRSSGSWHIACAASRQHTTWPRPSSNEYCLGAATSACTHESGCTLMHNYKPSIVRIQNGVHFLTCNTSGWFIRKVALSAVDCLCSKSIRSSLAADAARTAWGTTPPSTPPLYLLLPICTCYVGVACRSRTLYPLRPMSTPHALW